MQSLAVDIVNVAVVDNVMNVAYTVYIRLASCGRRICRYINYFSYYKLISETKLLATEKKNHV